MRLIEKFYDSAISNNLYFSIFRLRNLLKFMFNKIDFSNTRVLDIGGGAGLLSIYSVVMGAEKCISLEPDTDGASGGNKQKFNSLKNSIDSNINAFMIPKTFQEYSEGISEKFDIIIMANSINHLDESSVISLLTNKQSQSKYSKIFQDIYNLLNDNGHLIITDCSRFNFFNFIGIKNPLMPTIEWNKHQSPYTWCSLLKKVGFKDAKVLWSSPNMLGVIGRFLLGNRIAAYFTFSHFHISLVK